MLKYLRLPYKLSFVWEASEQLSRHSLSSQSRQKNIMYFFFFVWCSFLWCRPFSRKRNFVKEMSFSFSVVEWYLVLCGSKIFYIYCSRTVGKPLHQSHCECQLVTFQCFVYTISPSSVLLHSQVFWITSWITYIYISFLQDTFFVAGLWGWYLQSTCYSQWHRQAFVSLSLSFFQFSFQSHEKLKSWRLSFYYATP